METDSLWLTPATTSATTDHLHRTTTCKSSLTTRTHRPSILTRRCSTSPTSLVSRPLHSSSTNNNSNSKSSHTNNSNNNHHHHQHRKSNNSQLTMSSCVMMIWWQCLLLVFLLVPTLTNAQWQPPPALHQLINRETFLINFEDGVFACQINQSSGKCLFILF